MSVSCSFVIDNGAQFNYHIKLLLCTHFIYLFIEFNHAACSIYVYLCMNVRSVEVVVVVVVIYTILPDYGQFNRQKWGGNCNETCISNRKYCNLSWFCFYSESCGVGVCLTLRHTTKILKMMHLEWLSYKWCVIEL